MVKPTRAQMDLLRFLIRTVEPTMILDLNKVSKEMASKRIQWLLKKQANSRITRKLYMK